METNGDISGKEINKYIYKVICQNGNFAMGIFCRILDDSNKELAIALITTNYANIINKKIQIIYNNNKIPLEIIDDFDINVLKIIEINPRQDFSNIEFINLDYYSMIESCRKNDFNDKQVYLLDLHVNNTIRYNAGIIQDINDETSKMEFLCFQKGISLLGGFIIYYENNKVQLLGTYESPEDKKYWKDGTFICEYVKTFYEKNDITSFQLNRSINLKNKENQNNKKNKNIKNKNINTNKVNNLNKQSNKNNNNINVNNNNMNFQNNQNINNNKNYQNNQNINNNMNYQNNQNVNNNMNYQNNQNINNNMNYQNNQNINNNMNYQNNQNINNNMNYQNNQNIINNINCQNNPNINNNNLNCQNNQNLINENTNNQNMNIEYNPNNQNYNNNINPQKMDIENNSIDYQNPQSINNTNNQNYNNMNNQNYNNNMNNQNYNNMNNQNNNNNMNNQNYNNMNNSNNNSFSNQNNNSNCQNFNNMNNQPNNYVNNINQFNKSISIIDQGIYNKRRNHTFRDSHPNYNLDILYNNNQNMNAQYNNNQINNIGMNNNMNMNMNYQYPINFNMNIQNLNQMNKYTHNTNNFVPKTMNDLHGTNCEDIYSYIKENKINISFRNKDNVIKSVSIPASLRNCELYYTADKINNPDFLEYSDINSIKLYLNNQLIPNNDGPINKNELNNAQIFIMEIIEDLSYYDSIIQKSQNINKINISFKNLDDGKNFSMKPPYNIKVKDILLCFFVKNKIPKANRKYFSFTFSTDTLDLNNENSLNSLRINNGSSISFSSLDINNSNEVKYYKKQYPGKKLKVSLIDKKDELIGKIYASSLQQIKTFYKILINYLNIKKFVFTLKPVILISGLEAILSESNERTFSSYGILNDFQCKIDGTKNEEQNIS